MNHPRHINQLPLWGQAFRPFFLFGTLFGVLAILLWICWLNGLAIFTPVGGPVFWHAHEMLFGFVGAIVMGFLLTAVQNWTSLRAIHGIPLMVVFTVWGIARFSMMLELSYAAPLSLLTSGGCYFISAFFMARLLVRAKNRRNYLFVPGLIILGSLDTLSQYGAYASNTALQQASLYAAVLVITQMIMVIGGRVIPMFTANGTQTLKVKPVGWLDKAIYLFSFLSIPLILVSYYNPAFSAVTAMCLVLAAGANLIRTVRWHHHAIWNVPLVWSLHIAYLFIPLGQVLLAAHFLDFAISFSAGLHALTAGAMGNMILAMISRVSLGHSGRPLKAGSTMTLSFILLPLSAVFRLTVALLPALMSANILFVVGGVWAFAYVLFVVTYWRILTTPRADGRPG